MKKSSPELFATLSGSQIENLTWEVKETIALEAHLTNIPFTSVSLWNIYRQSRIRSQRRFL